jgi:hypothetical protein
MSSVQLFLGCVIEKGKQIVQDNRTAYVDSTVIHQKLVQDTIPHSALIAIYVLSSFGIIFALISVISSFVK